MKSIHKKNKLPSWRVIAPTLLVLFLSGIVVFYFLSRPTNHTKEDGITDKDNKANSIKSKTGSDSDNLPTNSESTTSDQIPNSTTKNISITSTSQANGKVEATAQASDDGTCVFQYTTEGDKPVTIQSTTTSKICTSSVPEVQFSKIGVWKLTVILYVNNEKVETSKDVTIN